MTAISNQETTRPTVTVEVWSDVVCPWCYIGKRKFASGLSQVQAELTEAGVDVSFDVSYHPYQLDPTAAPGAAGPVIEAYAKKFGGQERAEAIIANVSERAAEVGLDFRMDRALRANTLLAHRVIWLAGQPDSPVAQDATKERLLRAYFHDGLDIGDPDVLADCAAEVGFDRAETYEFLVSERGTDEVRAELDLANDNGITAVPTYVINGRWAVPGAQEPETFAQVLRKMADQAVAEQS
jgi:predicted DsbA family dithiol-disulfide isomerase